MPAPTTNLPHLVARLDATHESGMAHAIRVNAILREMARPHRLTVIGRGEPLQRFFPDAARLDPDAVGAGRPWESAVAALRPDLLLIDLPRALEVRWAALRAAYAGKIALIDDWGGAVDADLIINGTVLDAYHHYPAARAGATILAGPRYALLRPAFRRCLWRSSAAAASAPPNGPVFSPVKRPGPPFRSRWWWARPSRGCRNWPRRRFPETSRYEPASRATNWPACCQKPASP